jgi:hypothetical protein
MSDQTYAPRYNTFSPDVMAEGGIDAAKARAASDAEAARRDRFMRYLTWSILSICLALWAVVGFVFWVPLLLSSMIRFSLSLSRSMLSGAEPTEAGMILRNTVSFYRRGFTVAIDAVFGDPAEKAKKKVTKNSAKTARLSRHLFFEVLWAFVFWYLVLYFAGAVQSSPLDGWVALFEFPWRGAWGAFTEWTSGLLRA